MEVKWISPYRCIIMSNGTRRWFFKNDLHREDGPAIEFSNGTKFWYLNSELNREDGPAIEFFNGTKEWWLNNRKHREDGPAVERIDGIKEWYNNGKRHRENGPAVIYADNSKEWWFNGTKYTHESYIRQIQINKIKTIYSKSVIMGRFRNSVYGHNTLLGMSRIFDDYQNLRFQTF